MGMAGLGANGPDYAAFAQTYLDPTTSTLALRGASDIIAGYDDELYGWLQQRFGYTGKQADAYAYFKTLPALQQDVFLRQVYFSELDQGGLEFNDPTSARYQSYLRGKDAIAALFPDTDSYSGSITLFGNAGIHTLFGGDIQVMTPGGVTTVGVEGPPPPGTAGLITQGSGNIDIYSLGSILIGQSRIMTTFGGDIIA